MENVQARKEELQGFIDSRKKQLDEGVSLAAKGVIESEIAAFEAEIAAIEEAEQNEAAQQVRIQAQEEKVESITLPHNFNDVFDDPRADDIIIEVIKGFQRQANEEHNAEVEALIAQHREEIRAAGEREANLKNQNDELQEALEKEREQAREDAKEFANLEQHIAQLQLDKQDAEAKRDAAVRDKEAIEELLAEKQAHIDTLRDEIAIGASKAINVTNINPSDRLAALVEQSKSAKIKSAAELALENATPFRGKVYVDGVVAPPIALEEAGFPNQTNYPIVQLDSGTAEQNTADHQEVTAPVEQFQSQEEVQSGTEMANGTPSTDGQGAVTWEDFEELKGRVDHLYRVANISEVA